MELQRGSEAGEYAFSVPESVITWTGLQPYFTAMWARLLSGVPAFSPAKSPQLSLIIDGGKGSGHVWLVLVSGGSLPASLADPNLATSVHLEAPGVEELVSVEDEGVAALCQFAEEVLSAIRVPPALAAAEAAISLPGSDCSAASFRCHTTLSIRIFPTT